MKAHPLGLRPAGGDGAVTLRAKTRRTRTRFSMQWRWLFGGRPFTIAVFIWPPSGARLLGVTEENGWSVKPLGAVVFAIRVVEGFHDDILEVPHVGAPVTFPGPWREGHPPDVP